MHGNSTLHAEIATAKGNGSQWQESHVKIKRCSSGIWRDQSNEYQKALTAASSKLERSLGRIRLHVNFQNPCRMKKRPQDSSFSALPDTPFAMEQKSGEPIWDLPDDITFEVGCHCRPAERDYWLFKTDWINKRRRNPTAADVKPRRLKQTTPRRQDVNKSWFSSFQKSALLQQYELHQSLTSNIKVLKWKWKKNRYLRQTKLLCSLKKQTGDCLQQRDEECLFVSPSTNEGQKTRGESST